jgi:hypothetical protein
MWRWLVVVAAFACGTNPRPHDAKPPLENHGAQTMPSDAAVGQTGFDLYTDPSGVSLSLDGHAIGLSPLQVRNIQPGVHLLVASMDGYGQVSRQIIAVENEVVRITIKMRASP